MTVYTFELIVELYDDIMGAHVQGLIIIIETEGELHYTLYIHVSNYHERLNSIIIFSQE